MRRLPFICVLLGFIGVGAVISEEGETRANAFAKVAAERVQPQASVRGDDDSWFFLVQELRHLATGAFWEKEWETLSVRGVNPVPSMVAFHQQLEERGVRLIVAIVPAKARVYPEKLDARFSSGAAGSLSPFVEELRKAGIAALDVDQLFQKQKREHPEIPLYCQQDAHFSPQAIEVLADAISQEMGEQDEGEAVLSQSEESQKWDMVGDQVVGTDWEEVVPKEGLSIRPVLQGDEVGVTPDRASPFLLLGDSHTLVFHAGEENGMHCRGAGLMDQLSLRLGRPIDLVGVNGSGLVQARKQLFFRAVAEPGYWEKKRVVVWVFSERELTQSTDRIMPIPLDK